MKRRTFGNYTSLFFLAVVLFLLSSGCATFYATCAPTACDKTACLQPPCKLPWKTGERPVDWAIPMKHTCDVPNFYKINDNLYRSGQPTECGLTQLKEMEIRTIINLKEKVFPWTKDEEVSEGLTIIRVPMNGGFIKDDEVTKKAVLKVINILKDKNKGRVLIHCQHGSDRTGLMCAMYRILEQGWTKEKAIDEMVNGGYGFHYDFFINIINYIESADIKALHFES